MDGPLIQPRKFQHSRSRIVANLGRPRHRGVDLIAVESDENQTVAGKLAYTVADKDLENEQVELFACDDDAWRPLGSALTDSDGRFERVLAGSERLPIGMHDLFARVAGDGSGVRFLAYVAATGEDVIVTDVDGTITASETAIFGQLFLDRAFGPRPGAPAALAQTGRTIVYVTSRGDQFTDTTRRWLTAHGFPRGPLRLARSPVTLHGSRTVAFKAAMLEALPVPIYAAIGNKRSDVQAYRRAGVAASRIMIKLPEFESDVRGELAANRAVGFTDYERLPSLLMGSH